MSGLWRVPCRLVGLFILVACLIVPWPLIMTLPRVKGQHIQRWLFKNICRLFHITINITGRPETRTGVLYVANHTSYLDIIVLGSFLPDCSFIAKGDMSRWPIINLLCNIPRSIFVKRQADEAAKQKNILNTRLAEGDRLVLFAEGTTTLGHRVLPFKSSLFAAPIELAKQHQEILVQPITILP
ncbi:MAG: 1-acyl-sn-glycerol-3-phosphate acyltransferase, partial [Alphaproteobacteria bacterium]|nr:1-acyl-sn-glycerol-3-phosphate acyltransferase [Alphaproteobacteria bacterium]